MFKKSWQLLYDTSYTVTPCHLLTTVRNSCNNPCPHLTHVRPVNYRKCPQTPISSLLPRISFHWHLQRHYSRNHVSNERSSPPPFPFHRSGNNNTDVHSLLLEEQVIEDVNSRIGRSRRRKSRKQNKMFEWKEIPSLARTKK